MKRSIFFINLLLLLGCLFIAPVRAQDYYVCNAGSDTNIGTSADAPLATFDYAITKFNAMNAGDSVLFCRGGTFTSSYSRIFNQKCTAATPCTLADYLPSSADPGAPLPLINGNASGALNFQDGGNADHDEGYIIRNLSLMGMGSGNGIFLFNDVDHVDIDGLIIDRFSIGIFSAGANTPNIGANQKNDFITLKNTLIQNNGGQGWLGGCNDCLIDNNRFINNGFDQKIFNHNLYASNSERLTISGNELYKSTIVDGKCQGVSLVVHGVIKNLTIKDNTVHEDSGAANQTCWGISVDPGYATEESFSNVVIIDNKVTDVGNAGIGCASCVDASILNNTITHAQDFSFTGIIVPVRTEDTVKSERIQIAGNVIDLTDPNNRGKTGIKIPIQNGFNAGSNEVITH